MRDITISKPEAEWIIAQDDEEFAKWDQCSRCGYEFSSIGSGTPFCPGCGARMKSDHGINYRGVKSMK